MRELLLEVCVEVKRVSSLYKGGYDGCGRGIVRSALQPSLGCNPRRTRQNLDPTAPRLVRPNHQVRPNLGRPNPAQFQLAVSSVVLLCRLVNFGPVCRVSSEFLAHLFISLVLDIVLLIYRLHWCRFSSTLLSFSTKRLVYLILVEYYYSKKFMHCKHH